MTNKKFERYLGDGVYAEYDGYHIVLKTSDGITTKNTIFLDDSVFNALIEYKKFIEETFNK